VPVAGVPAIPSPATAARPAQATPKVRPSPKPRWEKVAAMAVIALPLARMKARPSSGRGSGPPRPGSQLLTVSGWSRLPLSSMPARQPLRDTNRSGVLSSSSRRTSCPLTWSRAPRATNRLWPSSRVEGPVEKAAGNSPLTSAMVQGAGLGVSTIVGSPGAGLATNGVVWLRDSPSSWATRSARCRDRASSAAAGSAAVPSWAAAAGPGRRPPARSSRVSQEPARAALMRPARPGPGPRRRPGRCCG
jgi:hypothetical protein